MDGATSESEEGSSNEMEWGNERAGWGTGAMSEMKAPCWCPVFIHLRKRDREREREKTK